MHMLLNAGVNINTQQKDGFTALMYAIFKISKNSDIIIRTLINSGAGGLMLESTAINNEGKITHGDLSISNKSQIKEMNKLIKYLKKLNNTIPIGLQISHSGRKGSANFPWIKKKAL